MNKTSLWGVIVVVAAWIGFMLGYSMSAHTGVKSAAVASPAGGGYGGSKPAASGAYGAGQAVTGAKPAAGGYGR